MKKRTRHVARQTMMSGEPSGLSSYDGLRPSVARLLAMVDTSDPAWPDIAGVLREFKAAGIELDETSTAMAIRLGRQRWADAPKLDATPDATGFAQPSLTTAASSIVYYIRRGSVIKIGTTVDPRKRFSDLLPDEILAFEPGGRELEKARHGQFVHLRGRGEHFRDHPDLRNHIAAVRTTYGEPDPSWPTASTSGVPFYAWRTPRSASPESLTAAEAETRLGIKQVAVRQWTYIGKIQPVGVTETGANVFRRDQLIGLRDAARTRATASQSLT